MSDTPRTDNLIVETHSLGTWGELVNADFARELERENAELRERADVWKEEAVEHCAKLDKLERENAALREERNQLTADFRSQAKQLTQCNRELAQEISQRKIREQLAAAQKEATP